MLLLACWVSTPVFAAAQLSSARSEMRDAVRMQGLLHLLMQWTGFDLQIMHDSNLVVASKMKPASPPTTCPTDWSHS